MHTLNEMAISRKEMSTKIDARMRQIIENWCLVKYCSLHDERNRNLNHWRVELLAHLDYVASLKLKSGSKETVVKHEFTGPEYDTNPRMAENWFTAKLAHENINISQDIIDEVVKSFMESIPTLIDYMTSSSKIELTNYVKSV